jgi:hypothetical protein
MFTVPVSSPSCSSISRTLESIMYFTTCYPQTINTVQSFSSDIPRSAIRQRYSSSLSSLSSSSKIVVPIKPLLTPGPPPFPAELRACAWAIARSSLLMASALECAPLTRLVSMMPPLSFLFLLSLLSFPHFPACRNSSSVALAFPRGGMVVSCSREEAESPRVERAREENNARKPPVAMPMRAAQAR